MSNEPNGEHSIPVMLFSAAVMIALLAVTVMTFERGDTRTASYETPPGTTVLAKAASAAGPRIRSAGDSARRSSATVGHGIVRPNGLVATFGLSLVGYNLR